MSEAGDRSDTGCGCKVGTVCNRYDLNDIDDTLVARWTGNSKKRYSLRELAAFLNERILLSSMDTAGATYKRGEIANLYELLNGDDVSEGVRTEIRRDLEADGVPVEQITTDFISHQTVHTHLRDCLEASLDSPDDEQRRSDARDKIRALQNRTMAVTEDTVGRLAQSGAVDVGAFDVLVDVSVICSDCGRQYTATELLESGHCDCTNQSER